MTYSKHVSASKTPQTEPLLGEQMIKNAAGGFVYEIGDWGRLRRFLILGCEGGTYYASERKLTRENAECVATCLEEDGARVVRETLTVSDKGLAPKNDPAIFVLALASVHSNPETRKAAFAALPGICRIGTHLFLFVEYRQALGGGWGRGVRNAIAKWYLSRQAKDIAFQAIKYGSRHGVSHRDILRLAHPYAKNDAAINAVFDAICEPVVGAERRAPKSRKSAPQRQTVAFGWEGLRDLAPFIDGWLRVRGETDPAKAAKIIADAELQREFVPTELLTHAVVWEALLPQLGYTALIRNLGNLSKCGLLKPLSASAKTISARLVEQETIYKARVHPWHVLLASRTYGKGSGFRGSGQWTVVPQIVEALDTAFELSFHNVVPTGKRIILGIDVSGSMSGQIDNSPLTVAEAAAAMALITIRTEPQYWAFGFATTFRDLKLTAKDSLNDVLRKTQGMAFGGTDAALPIRWARAHKVDADAVLVYTDNETWAGPTHAKMELDLYRRERGPMKLGVVAFTATEGSIADPGDAGSMNFVGLDASLPQAVSAFLG